MKTLTFVIGCETCIHVAGNEASIIIRGIGNRTPTGVTITPAQQHNHVAGWVHPAVVRRAAARKRTQKKGAR